ncbi:PREDICTED: uncharacterized protein LOC105976240 [Erythranthe guttata]|uniref:uncharacterized protein LOC105976240 n=1 Tax=Erythranthe guttata TaxID=4155 RepID=UPI00064DC687|nr:PREDICTED: uncharacterized protein LOC105976240 [Erythranthe guttata]|eukprot:XP_012856977.1 PREDICTED: uncharacterized protein LOC105976240 [Erythranthe guttata]
MPGLDPKVAIHHLSVKKGAHPMKQGQRRFRPELVPAIEAKVNKLIEVGFIREVKYPTWISTCPKGDFPMPIAELMIDATTGHEALSFMDGSSINNQIRMAPKGEELTAFRTPKGIYCYKVMPFDLKNAGATYQRAMHKIFDYMLHKDVECYVNDLVVKSKRREDHLQNLRKVFERLKRYQLNMNPLNCAFGVTSGKFLGFVVRHRGIEIEQAKIDVILKIREPMNIHELKSLQGKLAYLRRFISILAGRCQPFSQLMKKDVPFEWDEACTSVFESIKSYLTNLPVLIAPVSGRSLILYIATQERSAGALLAQENDDGKKSALYYLSRTMTPNELNFSPIEKICLALIFAIQKLKHYFQAHVVRLISRLNSLKQVLADFLADHPIPAEWELSDDLPDEDVLVIESSPHWEMYFDGVSNKEGADTRVVFVTSNGKVLPHSFTLMQNCSNNVAQYQALILGLEICGGYKATKLEGIWRLQDNKQADALAKLASTLAMPKDGARISICKRWVVPPIFEDQEIEEDETRVVYVFEVEKEDWRQLFVDYLKYEKLPNDPRQRVDIRRRAARFIYYKDTLYRRSFDGAFLRCLGDDEAIQAIEEVHSGICGAHQLGPKLQFRIKRMGYYWPSMVKDCMEYAQKCQPCQFHANFIHQPPEPLHPTVASWPFDAWGLDVVGPTMKSSARNLYILAATFYFSKWAEAVPLREVKKENVADFIRINIIYHYGVPQYVITNNGNPFCNGVIDKLCEKFGFKQRKSSMYNVAANGLAEAFNKTLCNLLKKVIAKSKRDSHERMGEALWAYRTTYRTHTQATPYALVYGVEAVLPLENKFRH